MTISTCRILIGDVRSRLLELEDESIDCCVTSPPYWGLRNYGVEGQIGLEATPFEFVETMVQVFRDVRRVLKSGGTCWINLGDCYATGAGAVGECPGGGEQGARWRGDGVAASVGPMTQPNRMPIAGLKPKDLVGAPWRVAFALQADGWYLRSDIVWSKPNPMPESVTDRPTKAHEYVFLLSKSERYHYDAAAIAEPTAADQRANSPEDQARAFSRRRETSSRHEQPPASVAKRYAAGNKARSYGGETGDRPNDHLGRGVPWEDKTGTRNARTVWTIGTQPFAGAHFATFPEELARRCIAAGCPAGGAVLDPFFGAGTVGLVAAKLSRSSVGIEINPEYAKMAAGRVRAGAGLLTSVSVAGASPAASREVV